MTGSWKLSAYAPKKVVQTALLAHDEVDDWNPDLVIAGRELSEDQPEDWVLEAWYPHEPGSEQTAALASLFENKVPGITVEKLEDEDWVAMSQEGAEPIRAGPFYVHTPNHEPDPNALNFVIPAALAFGTGQHQTTAGCLEMLAKLKRSGASVRDVADIGTGTGLLAFAALELWPHARATASDIDPVCAPVFEENAKLNGVKLGPQPGAVTMVIADGMADPLLEVRGPYDLLIANILAGPLIELASNFATAVSAKGNLILSGLLAGEQEAKVRRAYRIAGFRLKRRIERGDWAVLWFIRRSNVR